MPKRNSTREPSFEELYTELEATIEKLEAGNLSLDEALSLYERGMLLAKQCNAQLDNAELRIRELAPSSGLDFEQAEDSEESEDL
jgi:exodeoxyribonuclease VII small subunit